MGLADGGFRSAEARQRYLAAYDELRALSPRPDVVHDIPTGFGTVRVYQHGPDGGVPVVLIHGFFLTSDRLLRSVRLPVQVLLASNTVHDSRKGLNRIQSVVPEWRYRLWPNASHALPAEVPDEVNACIRQFVIEHRNRK